MRPARAAGGGVGGEEKAESAVVFESVDLSVERGELLVICGAVGSGPSTLLAERARARAPLGGEVAAVERRAFVSQKAFVMNGSVRSNVLFERPFDRERYARALTLAVLDTDLALLPAGDATVVGEAGVQLSGGQRARLALARARTPTPTPCSSTTCSRPSTRTRGARCGAAPSPSCSRAAKPSCSSHRCGCSHGVSRVAVVRGGAVVACDTWRQLRAREGDGLEDELMAHATAAEAPASRAASLEEDERKDDDDFAEHDEAEGDDAADNDDDDDDDDPGMSLPSVVGLLRSTLHRFGGRRVDERLIESVCAAMRGESDGVESKREGLIATRDFAVYLKEFGNPLTMFLLVVVVALCALFSVAGNVVLAAWTDSNAENCGDDDDGDAARRRLGGSASVPFLPRGGARAATRRSGGSWCTSASAAATRCSSRSVRSC